MQIVIDIPESIYDTIQADEMISREQLAVLQMHILNGTPLPKGHGRLIDADKYELHNTYIINCEIDHPRYQVTLKELIDDAPTIIEADRAESEGKE